jgi:hypothetical protein
VAGAVGFDALLYVAVRFTPEYLRLLGDGPLTVGVFGAVGTALAALYPRLRRRVAVGRLAPVAAVGLLAWTATPDLGVPAAGPVLAGLLLVALWDGLAPGGARSGPEAGAFERLLADGDRPPATVLAAVLAAALFATLRPLAAIRVLAALAAAAGLGLGLAGRASEVTRGADGDRLPGPREALRTVRSLPAGLRSLVVGDLAVRAALVGVSVFVVVTVTGLLDPRTTALGRELGAGALFGLVLALELVVASLSLRVGPALSRALGPAPALLAGGVAGSAFPLLLVSVPPEPAVVAAVFAAAGTRFVGADARRRLYAGRLPDGTAPSCRALRRLSAVPAPLAGGLLYAVDPVLAFGAATALGAVGSYELGRFALGRSRDR